MAQEGIRSTTALMALDESEESAYALQWALERMLKPGDTIVLLHSQQIPYMYMVEPAPLFGSVGLAQSPELIIAFRKQQQEASRAILERGKKQCQEHQLTVKTVIKEGDPRENICETVTEIGADLLIMGSRGRGAFKRAILGSVSDFCAHNVNCPLLIAFWRTPERPYRQRFFVVRPCHKDMKCDVEVASYAARDIEEYRHFCDRKTQRPQPEEIAGVGGGGRGRGY